MTRVGVSESDAKITADALVTTETWGVHTHGTKLLPGYIRRLKGGGLRVDNPPKVSSEGPSWALVDGGSSIGQVTSTFAMRKAMEKAKETGIGYAGVFNSCHFGAAGYYAWLAANENLIGLSMANDWPTVAAPGSRKAVTGSNPLAFAIPGGKADPIMLDISTGAVAGGKVYAAQKLGKPIPDNWIVGPDGLPTTDLTLFPDQAALQPMAGHKGYGLALLIEALSALLTGAAMTYSVGFWMKDDPSTHTNHGAAFLAIDVEAMTPLPNFFGRVEELVKEIHEAPKAEGSDRIYLPGEMECEKRRIALRDGIDLPEDVRMVLKEMADSLSLDFEELE
ncbi:MAG: Ldh family oxidoreductase [Candidatus Omnitrophica bacterium]|nr:Ldh family oxidoreductase [Candidatus Omnitrophota bacterium]MCB9770802.1 Ldh family oxidoreductase [Candidatus Omnitrophota bacterium]